MAVVFSSLSTEEGLKQLDEYLLSRTYITGHQATQDDITVFGALSKDPGSSFPNVSRWYNHISALLASSFPGKSAGVKIEGGAAAPASVKATEAPKEDEDDDDLDLFGEETEEEKKAAEQRVFAMAFHSSEFLLLLLLIAFPLLSHGEIPEEVAEKIKIVNSNGPYYVLLVAGRAELGVVLEQGWFRPDQDMPSLDISARRFYLGEVEGCRTILALSGSGSVNAAQTTQLLLTHFRVKGVIHYGRAASANSNALRIGDVAIPHQFAHTGVWYWEKFGGDEGNSYTRKIANLTFSEYNVGEDSVDNKLQSVYFQRETLYTKPEDGKTKFWFNVDDHLYATAKRIEDTKLDKCVQKSLICLQEQPEIRRVERGGSANFYVNNEAFRDFLGNKLNIASIDTESAAIAMVCASEKKAFLAMRSVTNNGGGSSTGNDASVIQKLWNSHARTAIVAFFKELASEESKLRSVTGGVIW